MTMTTHVVEVPVADDEVVMTTIVIVHKLDVDGRRCYSITTVGEDSLSATLGLLEIVKHELLLANDANA